MNAQKTFKKETFHKLKKMRSMRKILTSYLMVSFVCIIVWIGTTLLFSLHINDIIGVVIGFVLMLLTWFGMSHLISKLRD